MRDPYEILGLSRLATEGEIKSAFRNLAKQYHPDTNTRDPKAPEKFHAIQKAYEILGDKSNRRIFDTNSKFVNLTAKVDNFEPTIFATTTPPKSKSPEFEAIQPDTILYNFDENYIGAAIPETSQKPIFNRLERRDSDKDIHITLAIPLREAATGILKRKVLKNGKILNIDVPKGAEHGQKIIFKGMGNLSNTSRKNIGDAIVTIEHLPDAPFSLEGKRAILDVPISFDEAILGAYIQIPTFDGSVELTIPANTTGREILRVKGKGWPMQNGNIGDLFVNLKIILPDTTPEIQLLAQKQRLKSPFNPRGAEFEV